MPSNYSHHELSSFLFDLDNLTNSAFFEAIDDVWEQIINDVHEYEKRELYKWYYGKLPAYPFSFIQSERPDIIYQRDEFVMGIESFQFDASKKTRKGRKQRQQEIKADRVIHEEYQHSKVPGDGFLSIKKPVDVEFSITNYCESLLSALKSHSNSIANYRNHLAEISPDKKILLSFFIEDSTALGNYVISNGKAEALNPLKLPFFLILLASIQGLDYVIIKTTDSYVPSLQFQKISKPILAELLKNCYSPEDKYIQYQYERESHYWG